MRDMHTKRAFVMAAALVLAGCTQKENPVVECVPVALTYTTVQTTDTKAAQNLNEDTIDSGEDVKVLISNADAYEWTYYTFTTAANGAMNAPDPAPYYPEGEQHIDIVAYYPATAGTWFTVATDQTTDAAYKASDLMLASAMDQQKQDGAVELEFSHKMAKLNVNITAGTGVSSINSISILNVQPKVYFNPATGEVDVVDGTATTITVNNNGAALIPAQTIEGDLLSIVTDKGTVTLTVNKTFEAGKQYTINLTINLRALGGHEFVDMGEVTAGGVTKNLLWATCNLGATSPLDYGDLYAWGATATQTDFDWAHYPFMETGYSDQYHITKYNSVDKKTSFAEYGYVDDAARKQWGGTWRIPTNEELEALCNTENYDWVWQDNYQGTGITGMLVTRKEGPCAGNSIFLPANKNLDDGTGGTCNYWTSSLFTVLEDLDNAYNLSCGRPPYMPLPSSAKRKPGVGTGGKNDKESHDAPPASVGYERRYIGCSIRPVSD